MPQGLPAGPQRPTRPGPAAGQQTGDVPCRALRDGWLLRRSTELIWILHVAVAFTYAGEYSRTRHSDKSQVPERTAMPNSGYGQPGLRSPILRVRTARAEIADPMLNPGTWHLWAVPNQYAAHHNEYRPHRGRNLRPPGCRREHSGRHRRSRHAQDATSQVPGGRSTSTRGRHEDHRLIQETTGQAFRAQFWHRTACQSTTRHDVSCHQTQPAPQPAITR